jgi:hypothetical protein
MGGDLDRKHFNNSLRKQFIDRILNLLYTAGRTFCKCPDIVKSWFLLFPYFPEGKAHLY